MLNNRLTTIATTALAPAIWGTTYLVTTELLPPDRPLFAAFLRALPAGLVLVALTRTRPHGTWWWRASLLGALNIGGFFALLFVAAYRLPGGVAATVLASQPLIVAGLAAGLLGERLRLRTAITAATGVAGVSLLVLRADARLDTLGIAAAIGGAIVMATGVVLSKRWPSPLPLLATTGWQLVAGGLLLFPVMFFLEGAPPATLSQANIVGYAYLGLVGGALAYSLWFRGIRDLTPTRATFLGLLSPVVATTLGWLVLDQGLEPGQVVGGLVVLAAIVAAQTQGTPGGPAHRAKEKIMRITVFGAGGRVGSRVVTEALFRGHEVTAVVRSRARFHELDSLATPREGDAATVEDVATLSVGQDVVISATRPPAGHEHELVTTTEALLAGLARTDTRLLLVGGAASLTVLGTDGVTVMDDATYPTALRAIALACTDQLTACRSETEVDWAYLSPAAQLEPGPRTGSYRLGTDELLVDGDGNSTISMEDLAVALLDEAEQPAHHQTRFTVGY